MEDNQKVKIIGGDYQGYAGKTLNAVNKAEWLVDVNLGGGKRRRAAIDERFLEPIKIKPVRQVRGRAV